MDHTLYIVRFNGDRVAPAPPAGKIFRLIHDNISEEIQTGAARQQVRLRRTRATKTTKRKRPVFFLRRKKQGVFLSCCASLSAVSGTQELPRRMRDQLLKSAITFLRDLSQAMMQSSQPSNSMERKPS